MTTWLMLAVLAAVPLYAQPAGYPVEVDGKEILRIYTGVDGYRAEDRARDLAGRIATIAQRGYAQPVTAHYVASENKTVVSAGAMILLVVHEVDAQASGRPQAELAAQYVAAIQPAILNYRSHHSFAAYVLSAAKAFVFWVLFLAALVYATRGLEWVRLRLNQWVANKAAARTRHGIGQVVWQRVYVAAFSAVRIVFAVFVLFQFSFLLSYTFSLFPQTAGISTTLVDYLRSTFGGMARAVIDYLPSGGFVIIVCVIVYYILRVLAFLTAAVEHGELTLPWLLPEMARPTYQLVRILVVVFALVVVFPYLPGGQSEAFKGVSIFLGVLISVGSGSSVSNALAGIMLTYMRPYRIGDRVKIADTLGDVIEKNLLVTRLRTIKNVEVVVPNAAILGAQILNYSAMARERGLVLHTAVTIGYDAPWRDVHAVLLRAAERTDGVLHNPAPYILQTSLNDFHISYELNAFTDRPNEFEFTYSRLHQNIQDSFNEAGMEIMSPTFLALRDGNTVTTPEPNRPAGYKPPSFRVEQSPPGV